MKARVRTLIVMVVALGVLAAACGGGSDKPKTSPKPKALNLYASVDTKPFVQPLVAAFEKANPGYKATVTYVPGARVADSAAKAKADAVITTGIAMRLVEKEMKSKSKAILLGWDEMVIAVAKGNPKKITSVTAFAAGSPTTSMACVAKTTCGKWTERVLKNAGVTPAADRATALPAQVVNAVATGTIDGALLQRTTAAARAAKVQEIAIPAKQNVRLVYQAGIFDSGAAAVRFGTFVKSKQAKAVLSSRGYLPRTIVLKPKGASGAKGTLSPTSKP